MNELENRQNQLSHQEAVIDDLKKQLNQKNLEFQIINEVVHEISQELDLKKYSIWLP